MHIVIYIWVLSCFRMHTILSVVPFICSRNAFWCLRLHSFGSWCGFLWVSMAFLLCSYCSCLCVMCFSSGCYPLLSVRCIDRAISVLATTYIGEGWRRDVASRYLPVCVGFLCTEYCRFSLRFTNSTFRNGCCCFLFRAWILFAGVKNSYRRGNGLEFCSSMLSYYEDIINILLPQFWF